MFLFETVESRKLLAFTITPDAPLVGEAVTAKLSKTGVLTINGTSGRNIVEVSQSVDARTLRVTSAGGVDFLSGYGRTADRIDARLIKKIVVNAGAGRDRISVSTTRETIKAELNGGGSDDTITARMMYATLSGGAGNDYLISGFDARFVSINRVDDNGTRVSYFAGAPDTFNRLEGGSGDDRLATRGGEDSLYGGDGEDTVEKLNDMTTYFTDLPLKATVPSGTLQAIEWGRPGFNTERVAVFGIEKILAAPVESDLGPGSYFIDSVDFSTRP